MLNILLALCLGLFMIVLTSLINYEILRSIWNLAPKINILPRLRVMVMVAGVFAGQIIAIALYGVLYTILIKFAPVMGALIGGEAHIGERFDDATSIFYFSASTYSSLGYGDIVPEGALRIIAGMEVLNGLVLIGWSVSFTYLMMQQFWGLQHFRFRRRQPITQEKENHDDS
jgi:hypothetical protein